MKNEKRIHAAQVAMDAYEDTKTTFSNSHEENLIDLMTDLRHWCKENSVSFDYAVRVSLSHFEDEK